MILSREHKFIFIATPKTGTTSIEYALSEFQNTAEIFDKACDGVKHITLEDLKKRSKQNLGGYFSFSFCRNPWDRHLSIYKHRKKMVKSWMESGEKMTPKWKKTFGDWKKEMDGLDTFRDFVLGRPWIGDLQIRWMSSELDFVGRFENLREDFNIICDKIGIPRQKLPHKNKSKHKHYTEYYDDETREIVAKKYAKDIKYGGYEYGI